MSTNDWTMGSGSPVPQASLPPGRTIIAEVTSVGAIAFAPRILQLHLSRAGIAVRESARLLWLETDRLSAFTDADGQIRVVGHEDGALFVPRDTGAEARALASLGAFSAWCDLPSGSERGPIEQYLGRASTALTVGTGRRSIAITLDLETGVVLAARGRSLRGPFELRMTSVDNTETIPDHFTPNGS
jgi:hypothetical protein